MKKFESGWIQWRSFVKELSLTETDEAFRHLGPTPKMMLNIITLYKLYIYCDIMYRYNLQDGFPNVFIAPRIHTTFPVSNCSGERSLS